MKQQFALFCTGDFKIFLTEAPRSTYRCIIYGNVLQREINHVFRYRIDCTSQKFYKLPRHPKYYKHGKLCTLKFFKIFVYHVWYLFWKERGKNFDFYLQSKDRSRCFCLFNKKCLSNFSWQLYTWKGNCRKYSSIFCRSCLKATPV